MSRSSKSKSNNGRLKFCASLNGRFAATTKAAYAANRWRDLRLADPHKSLMQLHRPCRSARLKPAASAAFTDTKTVLRTDTKKTRKCNLGYSGYDLAKTIFADCIRYLKCCTFRAFRDSEAVSCPGGATNPKGRYQRGAWASRNAAQALTQRGNIVIAKRLPRQPGFRGRAPRQR